MQMGARELLMHYMDLKQTNDVQLTFEALKVNRMPRLVDLRAANPLKVTGFWRNLALISPPPYRLSPVPGISAAA